MIFLASSLSTPVLTVTCCLTLLPLIFSGSPFVQAAYVNVALGELGHQNVQHLTQLEFIIGKNR